MITAVVMVGERGGASKPEAWVHDARRAAARDLIEQLDRQAMVHRIIVVSPEVDDFDSRVSVVHIRSESGAIHVGRYLAEITRRFEVERLLYFGGGSAPLLHEDALAQVVNQVASIERGIVTNNQFASDWAGIVPTEGLRVYEDLLPKDNMLGWVLSTEAGLPVHALTAEAASRLDIDTPVDLLTLRLHPNTNAYLRHYLATLPLDTSRLEAALAVLSTPASHVFIAGRFSPDAWLALNRVTHSWLRVISEERGMVSSGRMAKGEVYSLLGDQLATVGSVRFVESLAKHSEAAFIDSRVLMAHFGLWPPIGDRFASDLGLVEQIDDLWLRDFTAAILTARIPIVLGGHGLLSGNMFAFCDFL